MTHLPAHVAIKQDNKAANEAHSSGYMINNSPTSVTLLLTMEHSTLRSPAAQMFTQHLRLLSLTMGVALFFCTGFASIELYKQCRSEMLLKTVVLANNVADQLVAGDVRGMQNLVLNTERDTDITDVTLYDHKGRAVLSSNNGTLITTEKLPEVDIEKTSKVYFSMTNLIISTPVSDTSGVHGQLIVQSKTTSLYRRIFQLFLLNLTGFIALTVVTAYALAKRQIQRLQPAFVLSEITQKVAASGDFSIRSTIDEHEDLARLHQHFNQMMAKIESWESDVHSEARERREAENRLHILENHDSLTKLPNRHYFHRLLTNNVEDAIANQEMMALMFIDLDHFKDISNTFGYDVCDQILSIMAQRLSEVLRNTDSLCRVDADEFAAVLPRVDSLDTVRSLASRLVLAMQKPMTLQGKHFVVTGSIGIACCPLHAVDQRLFLHFADLALKNAKSSGRNTWSLYDPNTMKSDDPLI